MPRPSFNYLEPNRDGLLHQLSERVDDALLHEIARADYGEDAAAHLTALKRIRDEAEVPPRTWVPLEVLELVRWIDPDDATRATGSTGQRGHLARAFVCAALLRMGGEAGVEPSLGENSTVLRLMVSASSLGPPFPLLLRQFLTWRLANFPDVDVERPFFTLGLLLLSLSVKPRPPESDIAEVMDWLIEDEQRIFSAEWAVLPREGDRWLLRLSYYGQDFGLWRRLGAELADHARQAHGGRLQRGLMDLAQRLAKP